MNSQFEEQLKTIAVKKIGVDEFNSMIMQIYFSSCSEEKKLEMYTKFITTLAKEHVHQVHRDLIVGHNRTI